MAPLSWRHHTLLQALLHRGPLSERDFHAVFASVSGKDPDMFTQMAYYVIFNGEHAGLYLSCVECSKVCSWVRGAKYKKYRTHEQALREFRAAMRDPHLQTEPAPLLPYDTYPQIEPSTPPLPYDPMSHSVLFAPSDDGDGTCGCWKVVLTTVVLVFGIWITLGNRRDNEEYPS